MKSFTLFITLDLDILDPNENVICYGRSLANGGSCAFLAEKFLGELNSFKSRHRMGWVSKGYGVESYVDL